MAFGFFASIVGAFFGWSMALLSLFLILLVLVQRGRGGGLTGALGGPGGQSAFGSKAGDMFTRITFVTAGLWIFLCAAAMYTLGNARSVSTKPPESSVTETPATRAGDRGAAPVVDPDQPVSPGGIDIGELLDQAREQGGAELAPGTAEPRTAEPRTAEPRTAEPRTAEPGAAEADAPAEDVPAAEGVEEVPAEDVSEVEATGRDAPEAGSEN